LAARRVNHASTVPRRSPWAPAYGGRGQLVALDSLQPFECRRESTPVAPTREQLRRRLSVPLETVLGVIHAERRKETITALPR